MTSDAPYDIKQKVEHPSLNPDLQTSGVKVVTITVSDLASLCAERDQAQAELQAAVAAALERAEEFARIHSDWAAGEIEHYRRETQKEAHAALEAVKREARHEGAEAADKLGYHCIGCGHLCGDPEKDLRLIRKAGAKSCCPEREMEPLSAAILTLMEDTDDE